MPEPLPELKNSYFLLRHGQSEGNVEGVISSARSLATSEKHGLTKLGYEQGVESATNLLDLLEQQHESSEDNTKNVIFYSSPFSRARQTAQACLDGMKGEAQSERAKQMGLDIQLDMIIEDGLMERYVKIFSLSMPLLSIAFEKVCMFDIAYRTLNTPSLFNRFFGRLDAEPLSTYGFVWPVDMINVTHTEYDVESVAAVSTRIREVVLKIDEQHEHCNIVLVSHADVLQITQCYAAGLPNVGLFSQYRFGNGEARAMQRSETSLPEPAPLDPPEKA